jgi:Lrp/AsnC family transcriptional regulator, leucine-responsive regulatory protein
MIVRNERAKRNIVPKDAQMLTCISTMASETEKLLDEVGWELLRLLQEDARLTYAELGKRVWLSARGVADRIRRMEEAGIIRGYRAEVSPEAVGAQMTVIMSVSAPWEKAARFAELARRTPEVLECHYVTGDDTYFAKVVIASVSHLAALIERLEAHSEVTTSIVLSSPVSHRPIGRELLEATEGSALTGDDPR